MELGAIVALIIIGALAGTAAASVMKQRRRGGLLRNTIIGVIGAVVGGFLFDLLDIGLPSILEASISLADVIVAFIGAIIVIFVLNRLR